MSFESALEPSALIIHDGNAESFRRQVVDPSFPFSGGYENQETPCPAFGSVVPAYTGDYLPESEWDDHIARQDREQSSPDHWRLAGSVPVLDQNGLGYCWIYGVVGAVMTCYAMNGHDPVPALSATGPGAQGKNFRNVGGWALEAIEYIDRYGIPTLEAWPEHTLDRSLVNSHEVELTSKMHGIVEFEELPRNDFRALVSVLLDPIDPRPVTLGLNWWGHLVYATKVVKKNGVYLIKIVNSWRPTWGQQGCAYLTQSKATAYEQVKVKRVLPRIGVAA